MRLSPVLAAQTTYPFVRLDEAKRRAVERGIELIDFGIGDPRERTEPFIEQALADALPATAGYPRARGVPELRDAIARWCDRRFGVRLDAETQIIPSLGSKEPIFALAQLLVDPAGDKRAILVPDPAYPVPERGAGYAHAEVVRLPLLEENGYLPDLDAVDEDVWSRAAIVWVQLPEQPDRRRRPLVVLRAPGGARGRARRVSSPPTRPTRSSGSSLPRRRRCRCWAAARGSPSSTRSRSARP